MKVEIITIGDELLMGGVLNTNAAYIAGKLSKLGFEIIAASTVGDDEWYIEEALHKAVDRADAIIVTGGLGPTPDDMTTWVAAKVCSRRLVLNERALENVKKRYEALGLEMPQEAQKQAILPEKAEVIPNPYGTACGYILHHRGKILIFLPGVPREMERLTDEFLIDFLIREKRDTESVRIRLLKTFGLTESKLIALLKQARIADERIKIGFLPVFPENYISITSRAPTPSEAEEAINKAEEAIVEKLGIYIYGKDEDTFEGVIGRLLKSKNLRIAIAESCTGGYITHRLTNVPGSSEYLERGVVCYSNISKVELLGVPQKIIETHGAVSPECAVAMAQGVRRISKTDIGLAVTGIAGPSGGTHEKPVGTVYIAMVTEKGGRDKGYRFRGDREEIKVLATYAALDMVRRYLLEDTS